jgi:hypothetical protein
MDEAIVRTSGALLDWAMAGSVCVCYSAGPVFGAVVSKPGVESPYTEQHQGASLSLVSVRAGSIFDDLVLTANDDVDQVVPKEVELAST